MEFLTPAACREELLGDLTGWYVRNLQYLMLAGIYLPLAIFKQIRRSFNRVLFAAEVSALILGFGSAAPVAPLLVVMAGVLAVLPPFLPDFPPSPRTPQEGAGGGHPSPRGFFFFP